MGEGEGEGLDLRGKFVWRSSAQPNYNYMCLFVNRPFSQSTSQYL
jgi:hypothetical protein